jgi:GT2 family glycosyltransferase
VRRAAALQAGGFFEAMSILFEDNDLSFRLRAAGHDVLVHADARCLHKGGTPGLSVRGGRDPYAARRSLLHSRNRWLYVLSCYRLRTLLLVSPALFAYGVVHFVFVVAQGHVVAWLRGKSQVVRLLPAICERRRLLAAIRTRPDRALLVCAPLTYNPGLTASRPRALVQRVLDGFLAAWWRLVRGAVG